jgi:DtxR family transcriptional regulator, Mn-dependent transcriptional regulator
MSEAILSSTVEDYLKAVLKMEDLKEKVTTSAVARRLEVTDPTVTDMLRKLQKAGLLEYKPYYGATLTEQGRLIALKLLRRHRLIELFLHKLMGYGWEQVHEEAEKLEHVVSDFFIERVDVLLNHPLKDPHGEAIPDAQGLRELQDDTCLAGAEVGDYIIRRVTNGTPDLLAYLQKEGLTPATRLRLVERMPFQGPLKVLLAERKTVRYVGLDVARRIHVSPADLHPAELVLPSDRKQKVQRRTRRDKQGEP